MNATTKIPSTSIRVRETTTGTVYDVRFRHDGNQIGRTFIDRTAAEDWTDMVRDRGAEAALDYLERIDDTDSMRSLAEYAELQLSLMVGAKAGTVRKYASYLRNSINPAFGDLPLSQVGSDRIAHWMRSRTTAGAAAKTVKNERDFISGIFKRAVQDGLITRNPCASVKAPRVDRAEVDFLTTDEFLTLVRFVPPYWLPLVMTFAFTGMRFGEATALTGADIDFVAKTIRISKAWSDGKLDTPKTRGSVRTIAAPDTLLGLLTPLVVAAGSDGLLFKREDGSPVTNSGFWQRVWTPVLLLANGQTGKGTAGLLTQLDDIDGPATTPLGKKPRIHDLRHSNASWLLEQGIGMDLVSRHLGHASIVTTVDTYGHISQSRQRAGAEALEGLFTQRTTS